eukprot:353211-Chlamydomonas_euryale.AAC.3
MNDTRRGDTVAADGPGIFGYGGICECVAAALFPPYIVAPHIAHTVMAESIKAHIQDRSSCSGVLCAAQAFCAQAPSATRNL